MTTEPENDEILVPEGRPIESMDKYWASANRFFQSIKAEGGNKYPDDVLPPVPDPEDD